MSTGLSPRNLFPVQEEAVGTGHFHRNFRQDPVVAAAAARFTAVGKFDVDIASMQYNYGGVGVNTIVSATPQSCRQDDDHRQTLCPSEAIMHAKLSTKEIASMLSSSSSLTGTDSNADAGDSFLPTILLEPAGTPIASPTSSSTSPTSSPTKSPKLHRLLSQPFFGDYSCMASLTVETSTPGFQTIVPSRALGQGLKFERTRLTQEDYYVFAPGCDSAACLDILREMYRNHGNRSLVSGQSRPFMCNLLQVPNGDNGLGFDPVLGCKFYQEACYNYNHEVASEFAVQVRAMFNLVFGFEHASFSVFFGSDTRMVSVIVGNDILFNCNCHYDHSQSSVAAATATAAAAAEGAAENSMFFDYDTGSHHHHHHHHRHSARHSTTDTRRARLYRSLVAVFGAVCNITHRNVGDSVMTSEVAQKYRSRMHVLLDAVQ